MTKCYGFENQTKWRDVGFFLPTKAMTTLIPAVAVAARQEDNPLHELRRAEARQRGLLDLLLRSDLPEQDSRGGVRSLQERKRTSVLRFQVYR